MDPLLTPIKGRSRALIGEGWPHGRMGRRIRLSPSLSPTRTLVTPYCKRIHPPWAQDNTKAAVFPLLFSPLCVPSRADPSGMGHAATIYSSVQGPPGVETPTNGHAPSSLASHQTRRRRPTCGGATPENTRTPPWCTISLLPSTLLDDTQVKNSIEATYRCLEVTTRRPRRS
jgi:hypothetical protein